MRALALAAAAFCAGWMVAAPAADARPWNDPAGRITLDLPSGWAVTNRSNPNLTYVIVGTADNECHVIAQPNSVSASASPRDVRHTSRQATLMSQETWTRIAGSITPVFPGGAVTYQSHAMDDTGFWPVHTAELRNNERAVHAGMQVRPGFDMFAYCMSYGSADPVATYSTFIKSMGNTNDAQWQAAVEAATPAPAPSN
jgi:hypothetical protein